MSLLNRRPVHIGRAQRQQRDDRIFLIATEDTHAPSQYFNALAFNRAKVILLPTQDGRSAPIHVVNRLHDAYQAAKQRKEVQANDEFWVLLDTDHWIKGTHMSSLVDALSRAQKSGFAVAFSNPCFELWLLLHHQEVARGTSFSNCDQVAELLRAAIKGYDKTNLQSANFQREFIPVAIQRARSLEENPDSPAGWPASAGTRVYLLLESILKSDPAHGLTRQSI